MNITDDMIVAALAAYEATYGDPSDERRVTAVVAAALAAQRVPLTLPPLPEPEVHDAAGYRRAHTNDAMTAYARACAAAWGVTLADTEGGADA